MGRLKKFTLFFTFLKKTNGPNFFFQKNCTQKFQNCCCHCKTHDQGEVLRPQPKRVEAAESLGNQKKSKIKIKVKFFKTTSQS